MPEFDDHGGTADAYFDVNNVSRTEPIGTEQVWGECLDNPVLDVTAYLSRDPLPLGNRTLLYRDDSHLTAAGVKVLQPAIQAQIRKRGINPEWPTFGGETIRAVVGFVAQAVPACLPGG